MPARLAGEVVAAARGERDEGRGDIGHAHGDEGRQRGGGRPEVPGVGDQRDGRRQHHGPGADGVDVVKVGALELDARRREAKRLVDEEIGGNRGKPRHGDDGKDAERFLQHPVDAEFHQQQRDGDIEEQPDDAARVAVGQAGKEVRPGERARIGVHHVDLELRDHDEAGHQQHHRLGPGQHVAEGDRVHARGFAGMVRRNARGKREDGEERTGHHLRCAENDPARAGQEAGEPVPGLGDVRGRQEAEEVDLLADLRHQREDDGGGRAELEDVEPCQGPCRRVRRGRGMHACEMEPLHECVAVRPRDEQEGRDVEDDPERLGDELETADQRDAVGDQRNDRNGGDDVADPQRHPQGKFERARHDRGLDGEEDEGEARVDQRGDGGADVAEAGAPGEQVDVDAVACRVAGDRNADEEDDQAADDDRGEGVGRAVGERDGAADRLQRQEGDRADGGLGNALARKAPGRLGGETQGVVFQCLVGDPLIVFAPNRHDALACGHPLLSAQCSFK